MTTRNQILRSSTPGAAPAVGARLPGELWTTFPDLQLGVIDATKTAQKLIAVRFFSTQANYVAGDFVIQGGKLYFAKGAAPAGAFNASQWSQVAALTDIPAVYVLPIATTSALGGVKPDGVTTKVDAGGVLTSAGLVAVSAVAPSPVQNGALWYDLVGGQLYTWVNDGTSSQWVVAVNQSISGVYLPLGGGTLTGDLILNRDPQVALGAATKAYADTKAAASSLANYLPLTGGTLSGSLTAPGLSGGNVTVTNGGINVLVGGATNPAMYLNDGVTNRSAYYFDTAAGRTQMYDIYSGSAIYLDPVGSFTFNGAGPAYKNGGGAWAAISDERIKTVLGDYAPGLDEVVALRPVEFAYKGNDTPTGTLDRVGPDGEIETRAGEAAPYPASLHYRAATDVKTFVGLVAQEVEAILPGMVTSRPGFIDGEPVADLRDVDTTPLIFALVNAVKTLAAEVNALKARGAR